MTDNARDGSLYRLMVGIAAAVIVIWGMQMAASFLSTVLLAIVLTISVTPLMIWLQRKGLPGWLAMLLTMGMVTVAFVMVVVLLGVSIAQLIDTLPEYQDEIEVVYANGEVLLARFGMDATDLLEIDLISPEAIVGAATRFLVSLTATLGSSVMLLLIMAFMLVEATGFPLKLRSGLSRDSLLLRNASDFGADIRQYMFIATWTGLLAATLDVVLLLILGVPFAVMWGLTSFFLSFVPNIGFVLALIPPALLALLEYGWPTALLVVVGYVLINGAVDSVLKPRVMGGGLNLSPLVVTLSLIFWAWVLGALGAILAVPLTMMVKKLVLESNEGTRWVADLIGSGPPADDESGRDGDAIAIEADPAADAAEQE